MGLEGIVAKRRDSPYLPGKRTDCWIKIKRQLTLPCVIIGYLTDGRQPSQPGRRCPGQWEPPVRGKRRQRDRPGTGHRLMTLMKPLKRRTPVVDAKEKASLGGAGVYCIVRCMEQTRTGHLRAPVFEGLNDAIPPSS